MSEQEFVQLRNHSNIEKDQNQKTTTKKILMICFNSLKLVISEFFNCILVELCVLIIKLLI